MNVAKEHDKQPSLIDTHCHIHDAAFSDKFKGKSPDTMIDEAHHVGVDQLICVGTDLKSSVQAIEFCSDRSDCYASVALHPHEAEHMDMNEITKAMQKLRILALKSPKKLVAIGECGLDYFYHDDPKSHEKQDFLLKKHLALARELNLPLIFHVRDAFSEFFKVFDQFSGLRGVVHSFTATKMELKGVLERGLYIGLNGIMTFTSDEQQLEAAKEAPLSKIVVETDAPFLTPEPFRGTMCEPKHVVTTAEFLSALRGETFERFATQTTRNAQQLFGLKTR